MSPTRAWRIDGTVRPSANAIAATANMPLMLLDLDCLGLIRNASASSSAGGAARIVLLAIVNLLKFLWCLRLERRASNQWLQVQGPVGAVSQYYDFRLETPQTLDSWEVAQIDG